MSSVAVVLCAPPLGLRTTIVRGPFRLRCTALMALRCICSVGLGASETSPPVRRRMAPCQPCSAGPVGAGGRELRKSARLGGTVVDVAAAAAAGEVTNGEVAGRDVTGTDVTGTDVTGDDATGADATGSDGVRSAPPTDARGSAATARGASRDSNRLTGSSSGSSAAASAAGGCSSAANGVRASASIGTAGRGELFCTGSGTVCAGLGCRPTTTGPADSTRPFGCTVSGQSPCSSLTCSSTDCPRVRAVSTTRPMISSRTPASSLPVTVRVAPLMVTSPVVSVCTSAMMSAVVSGTVNPASGATVSGSAGTFRDMDEPFRPRT